MLGKFLGTARTDRQTDTIALIYKMMIVNNRFDTNMQNVIVNQFKIRCPHLNTQAMALKTKLVRNTHC
jgi:hypothetical protein